MTDEASGPPEKSPQDERKPEGERKPESERRSFEEDGRAGAVLGFRVLRYSGIQGLALVGGNMLQLVTIGVVAAYLGPAGLGQYSLLLFLGGLVSMIFSMAAKPGTIRRTFGGGDDDDDDEDEEEQELVSSSPQRSLGAGILWGAVLGVFACALVVVLRDPITDHLLGGGTDPNMVLWSGVLGGATIVFRVTSISLWFERRPTAFLVIEIIRPLITLGVMVPLLALDGSLVDAIAAAAIGAAGAAALATFLLRSSYDLNLNPAEVWAITAAGKRRIPIVSSLWIIQNADVFILSRFVDHTDLGVYALASKLGIVVSFFPQGFRAAMRPLRKSAVFKAVRSQYGRATADGQILGYFVLICISSVLLMVLGGELLVQVAPASFEGAAPLIPFTAAGLVMPALWRTINGQTAWPTKRRLHFVLGTMGAAAIFAGVTYALAPEIGVYAAPVGMIAGFMIPIAYFFINCQRSENRIEFPYREVGTALAIAILIGGAYTALPSFNKFAELAVIAVLMGIYGLLLFVFRVIPESHWPAISQMGASMFTGRPDQMNPRRGLRVLAPDDRERLRAAVTDRMEAPALEEPALVPIKPARPPKADKDRTSPEEPGTTGGRLVWALRCVGREGGSPVKRKSSQDNDLVAEFLFADEPPAVRAATMRRLLSEGANAGDLRALEDLVDHLAKIPGDAWEGGSASDSPVARRRRAAGRRGRDAAARAVRVISKRL